MERTASQWRWLCVTLIFLWTIGASAADVTGLAEQSAVTITAQMAGAPFEGEIPPSVWAISFSPDGKYMAFGVQFVRMQGLNFPSYLLIVATDKPNIVLNKFEIPRQPSMANVSTIAWNQDGSAIAVMPYRDWSRAAVMDLNSNQLHVVPGCGSYSVLLSGPRIAQPCGSEVRFLGIDGSVQRWDFPGSARVLDVSPDAKIVALDFRGAPGKAASRAQYDVAILNIGDHSEIRRWSLPEATTYAGIFAGSGTSFCTVPDANAAALAHQVECRAIMTGEITSKIGLPRGPVSRLRAAGNGLVLQRYTEMLLPVPLLGTNTIFTHNDGYLLDLPTGRTLARWRIDLQHLLPKFEAPSESAVSSDGGMVAIGGSGTVRLYRVGPHKLRD